ncbi:MAG: MBL fold metallo-hydrolase [Muribaculaceae bacterium]|nr:MBL fold metallo-hydrolase [Muribaculaceae bacterium]
MFGSSTWLLGSEGEGTWLVDCGDVEPLVPLIAPPLRGVLLTHAHFDHIYGLGHLLSRFPAVRIVTNAAGREALLDEYQNLSAYHDSPFRLADDHAIDVVDEGDTVSLFNHAAAHVYATPGHHPSCLTYAIGNHLFTGDAYIPGVKVVTLLPGGDKQAAAASLERIARLAARRIVHPGHGLASPWR